MRWTILVFAVLSFTQAIAIEADKYGLKNLDGFMVNIYINGDLNESNMRDIKDRLRASVEVELRRNGIAIFDSVKESYDIAFLNVRANIILTDYNYIYSVFCEVRQAANLVRYGEINSRFAAADQQFPVVYDALEDAFTYYTIVTTWNQGNYGCCEKSGLEGVLNEYIKSYMDEFANDYLKANPR